ncbi:MAG: sigma-70 family RNA polymerase sigma factor [Acutalibacteraceae bacterium]|nr:sigma-70 family RNA polymerase sigma factor [Acutalibacteraceae bacterium]
MVEQKSRDRFIEENLGLVHSLCKRFSGRGIEYDDLYQAGCIGLIKATDGFDGERGVCFSTYAVPVIMGEIRRLFRDGGTVKVSRSVKELGMKINREKQIMEQRLCREPTVRELAAALSVSAEEITEAMCAAQPALSLTREEDGDVGESDLPTISAEDEISDRLLIDFALEKLDKTEKQLVIYRYYNYYTQSKTAKLMSMTQVQVSRAEKKILAKLREMLK